jgi:hypothetical protein
LRAEVVKEFSGIDCIIHAGDIDTPEVLNSLKAIAPTTAVRGNMDRGSWTDQLYSSDFIQVAGIYIHILHDLEQLDIDPCTAQINVIVNGHTHRPLIQEKDSVVYFNPGSAGYRRNNAPLAVGILTIDNGKFYPEIIKLKV